MLSTVLSKHSLSDNYYYLQHNRKCSYPKVFNWPLHPMPPLEFSTSRTLTASEAGVPGGQGPDLNPSCRRALSWVKCPASFMSGLAPPHSASTSSRIAMVTASSLTGREGLELRSRCQILPQPTTQPVSGGRRADVCPRLLATRHSPPLCLLLWPPPLPGVREGAGALLPPPSKATAFSLGLSSGLHDCGLRRRHRPAAAPHRGAWTPGH